MLGKNQKFFLFKSIEV